MRRLLLLLVCTPLLLAASREIDRVVAVVEPGGGSGRRVLVTLTELEIETRLLLVGRGAASAATSPLPTDTLSAALDQLVAEHLLLAEAEALGVVSVPPEEVELAVARLREALGGEEPFEGFLTRNELTPVELQRILRRRLLVERYVASRARLAVTVTEADLKAAHAASPHADQPLSEVLPELKRKLEAERREELLRALVADLKSRADVRLMLEADR